MEMGDTKIEAGTVTFNLKYRALMADQGICIEVYSKVDGKDTEILRFDCFDQTPHYHYGPEKENERLILDKTTAGNPLGWTLTQLRTRLPEMLKRAGYPEVAESLDPSRVATKLDHVEEVARDMAVKQRRIVIHNRGDTVIEVGNIRFGIEFRELNNDRGIAIHVLSDVAGQEIELLAFDCFEVAPHYHYGPRNQDVRLYWDTTAVPDTLRWALHQFKSGKLPAMIQRAGYPGIVAGLDEALIADKLEKEIEPQALAMRTAHAK